MAMYLDIQTPLIAGESLSPNPNWNNKIEIQHWTYDVSQSTSQEVGTGLVSSGSRVGHIHVTKVMDKSSPMLFAQLCAGKPIDLMYIRVSNPGRRRRLLRRPVRRRDDAARKRDRFLLSHLRQSRLRQSAAGNLGIFIHQGQGDVPDRGRPRQSPTRAKFRAGLRSGDVVLVWQPLGSCSIPAI